VATFLGHPVDHRFLVTYEHVGRPLGLRIGLVSGDAWLTFTYTSTIYLAGSGNLATGTHLPSSLTATTFHLLFAINVLYPLQTQARTIGRKWYASV